MSNIFVDDKGEGFPFVLVHGYLGSSEMWCFQKDYFSKNCRVIAPALPGFGESHNAQSLNSINAMAKKIIRCFFLNASPESETHARKIHCQKPVF